jgi:hypothetical protein
MCSSGNQNYAALICMLEILSLALKAGFQITLSFLFSHSRAICWRQKSIPLRGGDAFFNDCIISLFKLQVV